MPLARALPLVAALLLPVLAWATTVESFSPQGTARAVRQVAVRFSDPVVRLGDPRPAAPFAIDCPAPGRGRWVDPRHWVFDFDADLPSGVACRWRLSEGLVDATGERIEGPAEFAFDTGGPAIRASLPEAGSEEVDEDQVFLLALDGPVEPATLAGRVSCQVEGIGDRIAVEVLGGAAREAVLGQRRMLGYRYWSLLWRQWRSAGEGVPQAEIDAAEAALIALRCRQIVPPGTAMELVWGPGVAAPGGVASTQEQRLAFRVRPAFTASFSCERANARAQCLPQPAMTVNFSAPVPAALAAKARLRDTVGTERAPKPPEGPAPATVDAIEFAGPFPERGTFTVVLPPDLVDDAGRRLANAGRFPLEVRTDEQPPLAKFAGEFGILERATGGVLPVTLRNVEAGLEARRLAPAPVAIPGRMARIEDDAAIARWIERVREGMAPRGEWLQTGEDEYRWQEHTGDTALLGPGSGAESFAIPRVAGAREFEVVGIPLRDPGFHVVELASPKLGAALLGREATRYVATTALVTNLAVHFKWGRESSRVWVTRLDDATPVPGARIAVTGTCDGARLWEGETGADGLARIDATLPSPHGFGECADWHPQPLIVTARLAGDFSFALSHWQRGIQPSDFGLAQGSQWQATAAHTIFDRALFRAGETVSMKHYLRSRTMAGFAVPAQARSGTLVLAHRGSDQRYEFETDFDAAGIATGTWTIPADAKLGDYDASLRIGERTWTSGAFRVEQYRVPLMRAAVQGPQAPLIGAGAAAIDVQVGYLAGGPAAGLAARLRTQVEPVDEAPPGWSDYTFSAETVVEGVEQGPDGYDWFGPRAPASTVSTPTRVTPVTLDAAGGARITVPDLPAIATPHVLVAELEYPDPNGELLSVARRLPLWPARLRVGLRTEGWSGTAEQLRFRVVVLDLDGRPLAGRKVAVELYTRATYSYRKRLIGGFYAYESTTQTRRAGELCTGRTDAGGLLACDVAPGVSGQAVLRAVAIDADGREVAATRSLWLAGEEDWWFGGTAGDRMDVLPERRSYEAGETARLQVRMPFRSATALVTVEREGVIDAFVVGLSGREPVIEVPIAPGYAPNAFVSVLAVRGRVGWWGTWLAEIVRRLDLPWPIEGGLPTALVDLSKPAWKLGVARLEIGWRPHRLEVDVTPDAPSYPVRGTAKVAVQVRRADGGALPAGAEVALAAVDEGLLELMPNGSWNLLDAMMGERGLEVLTATAQMQVVGKRHYGRKAVPHGGGGGREPARELFDTLLAWQGRVALDAQGRAQVEVPLNDSLTAFRIVAIASAGSQWFGTGRTTIRSQQPVALYAGLPPVVREGDRYAATFTVRNAGEAPRTLEARARTTGVDGTVATLPAQSLTLAPGETHVLAWNTAAPAGAGDLAWEVEAVTPAGELLDRLRARQTVQEAVPVRVQQATLAQVDGRWSVPATRPADALAGRGGIRVDLRASLAGAAGGVRDWMARYPYTCMEQRVSRAVALADDAHWRQAMDLVPAHLDGDGLLRYWATDRLSGSDTLTAYVLAVADAAGRPIPPAALERMKQGLRAFVEGRIARDSPLPTADLAIRKVAALDALARHGAARPEDVATFPVEPERWPTSALLDWIGVLQRVDGVPDRDARRAQALRLLRARMDLHGSTLDFSTARDDALWWLMASTDANAARAVLATLGETEWREDLPRMIRGVLGRQQRGRWDTTVANAWGVLALAKFAQAYESAPVDGHTTLALGAATAHQAWSSETAVPATDLPWPPDGAGTLVIEHAGRGRPWALVQTRAALPLREPLQAGYRVTRTLTPIERAAPDAWTVGDVVRVRLDIEAQSDMAWVVVDDAVPGGATIIGSGLGGDSVLLAQAGTDAGAAWPAYEERRFDAFRTYYRYVPKGSFAVEYTLRLNASGTFGLPPTRVEAMYAPEMHAELPVPAWQVQARP